MWNGHFCVSHSTSWMERNHLFWGDLSVWLSETLLIPLTVWIWCAKVRLWIYLPVLIRGHRVPPLPVNYIVMRAGGREWFVGPDITVDHCSPGHNSLGLQIQHGSVDATHRTVSSVSLHVQWTVRVWCWTSTKKVLLCFLLSLEFYYHI